MNCQQISLLLDDGDLRGLSESTRVAVRTHLDGCADCARDWQAQQQLLRREPPEPGDAFTHRLWQTIGRAAGGRSGAARVGRPLVFGGLLLVGAAAAMLTLGPWGGGSDGLAGSGSTPSVSLPTDRGSTPAGAGGNEPVSGTDAPGLDRERDPRESASSIAPNRLVVLPTRHENDDRAAMGNVEATRAAMVEELRWVPDLDVVALSEEQIDAARVRVPFRVRLLALIGFGQQDAIAFATARHFGAERWVRVVNERPVGNAQRDSWAVNVTYRGRRSGGGSTGTRVDSGVSDSSPVEIGRSFAVSLYSHLFPEGREAYFEEFITATRLDDEARLKMLYTFRAVGRIRLAGLSVTALDGLVGFARTATDPSVRAQVWTMIGGSGHPAAAQPLTEALLYETDASVRTAAADELDRYWPELAVQIALEMAAQRDPSPEVRERSRWSLLYPEERLDDIHSTLGNTSLPPEQRVRALRLARTEGLSPAGDPGHMGYLDLDADALTALAEIAVQSEDPETIDIALTELGRRGDARLVALWHEQADPALRRRMASTLGNYLDVEQNREMYERLFDVETDAEIRRHMSSRLPGRPLFGF